MPAIQAHTVRYVTAKGIVNVTMARSYADVARIAASTARHIDASSYSIHSLIA